MFSLFRRRRDAQPREADLEEQRLFEHAQVPDAGDLAVFLSLGDDGPPVQVDLMDMNIQGAGVRMPFHVAPGEAKDQFVELTVGHAQDGWRVKTNARVTRVAKQGDQHVHVGLQFVNLGDLYAQLDDALGRYFNRRCSVRLRPQPSSAVNVRVAYQHHRLRGPAHDISRNGVGVRLTLVQAALLRAGEVAQLRLDVPTIKHPLEVPVFVRHGYRIAEEVVLGLEFDLDAKCSLADHRKAFHAYLDSLEREALELQRQLLRRGAA